MITQAGIIIDVGTPPGPLSDWTTATVRFHEFKGLTTQKDEVIESPEFMLLQNRWTVQIFPGGHEESEEIFTAVYLHNMSDKSIDVEFNLTVEDPNPPGEDIIDDYDHEISTFAPGGTDAEEEVNDSTWGNGKFAKREKLLNYLVDGTLIVKVHMGTTTKIATQFIPRNPLNENILKKFNQESDADVVFEVRGQEGEGSGIHKRVKTASTTFHAHHLILEAISTTLSDMCKRGESTPVQISNITPEVFNQVLYYCYGGVISNEDMKSNAKEIIDAADRFGIVSLKLETEACYIKANELTTDNVMNELLYSDSKNLALLKEASMDFIASNGEQVISKVSFGNVPGYLMKDLLTATTRKFNANSTSLGDTGYNLMRVVELRNRLHKKGLSPDGSREAMIALLKENDEVEESS